MTDDRTESEVYAGVMAECQLAGKGADLDAVIFECSGRAAATTSQEVEQVWDVHHHRDHDDRHGTDVLKFWSFSRRRDLSVIEVVEHLASSWCHRRRVRVPGGT